MTMHVIAGNMRNLKRRSKPLLHFLTQPCNHPNADMARAERTALKWMEDTITEPEPVLAIELNKGRTEVVTTIDVPSLNSLNASKPGFRFAGFSELGEPRWLRRWV
jgi:hypothetical protein